MPFNQLVQYVQPIEASVSMYGTDIIHLIFLFLEIKIFLKSKTLARMERDSYMQVEKSSHFKR